MRPLLFAFLLCVPTASAMAETPAADDAEVKLLADGFTFLEGPASAPNGDLYFVDLRVNKILRYDVKSGEVETITDNSSGTNGMQFDARGRLIGCQGESRRIVVFDPKTGEVAEVLADKYDNKRFNRPNDLWIDPQGGIYFTDPAYGRKKDELEQDGQHVYYITPEERKLIRVADDYNTPNGIVGTEDGKTLYITDRRLGRTFRYAIQADGTLAEKQLFCKVGADGMTLDAEGNLYTTPKANEIRVFSPNGEQLESIAIPTSATNVCFAGPERKTLFITTGKALYSIPMKVSGQ